MRKQSQKLTRSYLHVPHEKPLVGKTVGKIFNEMADKHPDKEMYVFYADKERKTYRQMQEESQQFAGGLLRLGLRKGDTLGVWGGNHYEWLLAYLASIQIGVITVNMRIDFPLHVQKENIKKLGIKVIVLMRSPSDMCDRASQIVPELLINSADCLNCKSLPDLKYVINAGENTCRGAYSLADFMEMSKGVPREEVHSTGEEVDVDDDLLVVFTSGSTGFPKGVTHTHHSIPTLIPVSMRTMAVEELSAQWTPKYALIMSFGGVGAQIGALTPVMCGTTCVIVGPTYDGETLAKVIHEERVTWTFMLIHHLNDILNLPNINDYDFSSFKLCGTGGSIIPRSLRERTKRITNHVLLAYGGTEGYMTMQSPYDPQELLDDAAYFPIGGQEVKIVGEDDRVLPVNTAGEICFRSSILLRCYWGDEEKTKAALKPTGWFYTGDLGTLDENGYMRIVGRKSERIIKKGLNIAPGNLEKVLDEHPAVSNVMVVGVPDERTGEEVCACLRLHPSAKATADEVKEFCKGKVSDFLIPKYVIFWTEAFPTTETGKFARKIIAEQAKTRLGL